MKNRRLGLSSVWIRNCRQQPRRLFRCMVLLLAVTAIIPSLLTTAEAVAKPGTSAESSILIEVETGTVLDEKKADEQVLIASTTKILTALIVLENCRLDEKVIISEDFPTVEGSSMYLKVGEGLTVLELLYGLLLASGNDAAVALALHVAGSIDAFAELMNQRARQLSCHNSNFRNPHGLDADNHYSSARDLARIAAEAMKNDVFSKIVSSKYASVAGRSLKNHNKLLWNCQGAIGIKTGFTEKAGRSLVSCVERSGMRLVCVTLAAPNDWDDHMNLYNWAFSAFRCVTVTTSDSTCGSIPVISGVEDNVTVHPVENYTLVYPSSEQVSLAWDISKFVYAPVSAGDKVGMVTIQKNGQTIKTIPIVSEQSIARDQSIPLSFWEKMKWSLFRSET